jgi:hypothetical protein
MEKEILIKDKMGEMTRKACQIVKNRNNSSKKYKSLNPKS